MNALSFAEFLDFVRWRKQARCRRSKDFANAKHIQHATLRRFSRKTAVEPFRARIRFRVSENSRSPSLPGGFSEQAQSWTERTRPLQIWTKSCMFSRNQNGTSLRSKSSTFHFSSYLSEIAS
jgi:hypothetical protein